MYLTKTNDDDNMKYNEDKIEVIEYIEKTYTQHYSVDKSGFQVQDMLRHLDIDKDFCQSNAIKYLCRYHRKNKWIYLIILYCIINDR